MAHFEKTLETSEQFHGKIFRVTRDLVELENGNTSFREILHHNGGAGVVAMTADQEIYMVRQFRYAFSQELLEIPAGKLEQGEDPQEAALRELREECGLQAGHVVDLGPIYPTVGYDTEVIHTYLATDLRETALCPDEDEFITLEKWPLPALVDKIMAGEIRDGKTVAALLKVWLLVNKTLQNKPI